jgi:hypothetical protein
MVDYHNEKAPRKAGASVFLFFVPFRLFFCLLTCCAVYLGISTVIDAMYLPTQNYSYFSLALLVVADAEQSTH